MLSVCFFVRLSDCMFLCLSVSWCYVTVSILLVVYFLATHPMRVRHSIRGTYLCSIYLQASTPLTRLQSDRLPLVLYIPVFSTAFPF